MALLAARDLGKTYASHTLFERLSIAFQPGEHVGLIGPNGAGKSTLLKILAGDEPADSGWVEQSKGIHIAYLPQIDVFPQDETVEGALLAALEDVPMETYERPHRARSMLRRLGFRSEDADRPVSVLSGGWRKRLAIGCRLVRNPDLLLMDEPTNHLDLRGIEWLERFLERATFSFVLTSHDRYFLERVTDRIVEINRRYPDGFFSVNGRYSDFLEKREPFLQTQDAERRALANQVRREIEWLRRGPKARSSKASHRIDSAHEKIDRLAEARSRENSETKLSVGFRDRGRRTHDLIIAKEVAKTLGGHTLFRDLNAFVHRGTRLGIVGNNASGKTTLLRILAGVDSPDAGAIRHATDLRAVLFDQQREQLDLDTTLRRTLAPYGDKVYHSGRETHVIAWAKRFGFRRDQLDVAVGELSGGEQARVLMAVMMQQKADVLLLDEPTNDLDIPSVEVLENALIEFPGAIVLITHDRHMLDRVCTDLVGLHSDGHGRWGNYGSVAQWQASDAEASDAEPQEEPRDSTPPKRSPRTPNRPGLTYHEKKEWALIEDRVLAAEEEASRLAEALENPELASDHEKLSTTYEAHQAAVAAVEALYDRWQELDEKRGN